MIEQAEPSLHKLSHDNAWLYCATFTHDNKYDWRLPTDHELNTNDLLICNFQFTWAEDDMATSYVLYVVPVRDKMIEKAPVSSRELSIEEAFLYTITCTHNNKNDWRLPTHKEYMNCEHIVGWFKHRDSWGKYPVTPVRDNL